MSSLFSRTLLPTRSKRPAYEYAPLRTESKEIRLLSFSTRHASAKTTHRLNFNGRASHAQCHLIHAPLQQSPAFTALSYAWGTSKPSQEIELDGFSMLVSQNLLDALLSFSEDDGASQKLFWIDAVRSHVIALEG